MAGAGVGSTENGVMDPSLPRRCSTNGFTVLHG